MTTPDVTHHPDCDGWMLIHRTYWVETGVSALDGSIGYQACMTCDWRVPAVGSRPKTTVAGPAHTTEVWCDGTCMGGNAA